MDIRELVSNLAKLPDEATVFAAKINGTFRPDSKAVILEMTDEELKRPVADVARQRAPGTSYFLEVFIIREVVEGWQSNHRGTSPTTEQALESIILYAEHDAYPPSFFS
jgi:hypothetical protein